MKRLAKIFLAVLLFLLVAIVGLTIFVRVKYPSERLKQLLISYLAEEYKLRISIARLDFNLFSGFALDKIAILGTTKDTASVPADSPLAVEKIKFSYRWRSLLSRRLDIDEITIERPVFFYQLNPDSSSNLDAIFTAFADSTTAPSDTSATGLPISIHLKTLDLKDLRLRVVLASPVDAQHLELGPLDLSVNAIEVDRYAHFSGKIKLRAESAGVRYARTPVGPGDSLALVMNLQTNISSIFNGDSLGLQGELAFADSRIKWGRANSFSLPRIGTTANLQYNFASSQLNAPEVRLLIDDKEQLAARFVMNQQNGLSALAVRVNRGTLDLAELLRLAKAHTSGEIRAFLQNMDCAGELEFSGSEFDRNEEGVSYQIALRGRNLAYTDQVSGLKIYGGNLEANWKTKADSSAEVAGKFFLSTFDVPLDTMQVLKTGPLDLEINLALGKDFLPQQGDLDLSWQDFSEGKINAHVACGPASSSARNGSWLSRLSGNAEIKADAIEISPFAAGVATGKISSQITLAGKRLDEADLNFNLHNEKIRYATTEYTGNLPDYHLSASSKFIINSSLNKFSLPSGKLQAEPAQASFSALYDMKADTFRFNLPKLGVDLAQIMRALPDTILASMNYAKIKGHGSGKGWLKGQFLGRDSLDYNGIFSVQSEDAAYADSVLGIYTDSLQINSEWTVTTAKTTGTYAIACSTPQLPDYLRQSLPPTKTVGKLTVDATTFTINDGKFEIPAWNAAGNYRVDGEFEPAGMQVKTTVDVGLHTPKPITINRGTTWRGDLDGQFVIEQYIPDALTEPQPSRLNGWLRIGGLDVNVDTTFAVKGLRADCRFAQDFDLLNLPLADHPPITFGMALEPAEPFQPVLVLKSSQKEAKPNFASADEALLMYDLFRESVRHQNDERSWLTIDEINMRGYQLSNLAADLNLGDGRFDIPKFSVNLFDGNLVGNLLIGLSNGNPDSISYATNIQISSIDVSHFRRLRAQLGGKRSRVSANFALSGLGTAPGKLEEVVNNLAGKLNITKIENKVASNLLQMLDPKGTDKGIQNMRLLMKTRWNVKQLTFEMKSGFVYASLTHVKPWYAPFTLPQPLDFARFPIKPYLKTAEAE